MAIEPEENMMTKRSRKAELMTRIDGALNLTKRLYEELSAIKQDLQEGSISEDESLENEDMEYMDSFEYHNIKIEMKDEEEEEEVGEELSPIYPSVGTSAPIDKIPESDLWMMQYTAEHFDNKSVIELGIDSGVFIKKGTIKLAKSLANNENVFARKLLMGLFTTEALNNCSLDGKAIQGKEKRRPQLPEKAMTALLRYVHWHARKNHWKVTKDIEVKNSLRDKLKEFRKKTSKLKQNSLQP